VTGTTSSIFKSRTCTPYWVFLKPIFMRYGMKLNGAPYETQMNDLIKKWLLSQDITPLPRQGQNIDVVDFEFGWRDCRIGIELKGHNINCGHKLTKIVSQLKRYEGYLDFLIVITHSHALRSQIERVLSVTPKGFRQRIIPFRLQDIDKVFSELDKKIEQLGRKVW